MSFKLSRVASSEYDELLLLLEEGTTQFIRRCWYSTNQLEDILVRGDFSKSKLPHRFVSHAIRRKNIGWVRDTYRKQFYYCIDEDDRKYHGVVDQMISSEVSDSEAEDSEAETQSNHWECKSLPTIATNYILSIKLNHLNKYLGTPPSNFPPTADPPPALESLAGMSLLQTPTRHNPDVNLFCGACDDVAATTPKSTLSKTKVHTNRYPLPVKHDGPIGFYIASIGSNASVGKIFHDHAKICQGNCGPELTERYSIDY